MSDPFAIPATGQPYPASAAPIVAGEPRRLRGLAVAMTVLIGCAGIAVGVSGVGMLMRSAWADRTAAGAPIDLTETRLIDAVAEIPAVVALVVFFPTAIVMIVWQYRHATNAQLLGQNRGLRREWAIAGWFIPWANFVLPAVQMFGSSRYSHGAVGPDGTTRGRGAAIVIVWAIVFPLSSVFLFGVAEPGPVSDADYLSELAGAGRFGAAMAFTTGMGAAVLAIAMVWTLTRRQEAALAASAGRWWPVSASPAGPVPQPWQQPTGYGPPPPWPGQPSGSG